MIPRALLGVGALLLVGLVGTAARADAYVNVSEPRDDEKLVKPIAMPRCPGVMIVEWRASRFLRGLTGPTADGVKVLEDACVTALTRYAAFLDSRNMLFVRHPVAARVMIMPANVLLDGKDARNLNDGAGRFAIVQPSCCSWGIYNPATSVVFLRNDPILRPASGTRRALANRYFARTALHEMAHVLNHQWEVISRNYIGRVRDEELAEEWVMSLGIQYPTESSSENYGLFADQIDKHQEAS